MIGPASCDTALAVASIEVNRNTAPSISRIARPFEAAMAGDAATVMRGRGKGGGWSCVQP